MVGIFLGGEGSDLVTDTGGGTFNGDNGNDSVAVLDDNGTFNGGDGCDTVLLTIGGGTFEPGRPIDLHDLRL